VGSVEVSRPPCAGDEVRTATGEPMRVQAVVASERDGEGADESRAGFLIVSPLDE
jgi:hypothetical protein